MGGSEVAQFRQRIADQYQAAQWGLSGLASGASRHQFITHKMENLGGIFEQLTQIVESKHIAIEIVSETIEALPETPTRIQFTHILWRVLGDTDVKETRVLLDSLEGMWKTIDMLKKRFGHERAQKIIALPSPVIAEEGAHE
jgi:hypothetical protein